MNSRRSHISFLVLIVAACAPLVAGAQSEKTAESAKSSSTGAANSVQKSMLDAKGRKITVVNFDDALIEGKARGPDGFILRSRQSGVFRSILELRRDFREEVRGAGMATVPVVPSAP